MTEDNIEVKELVVKEAVEPLNMSVPELARQLEKRTIMPEGIRKAIRLECAWYLKSWGRSNAELGRLLALNVKMIQRYIAKKKKGISLKDDPGFQRELMSDIVYGWRARRQRLLRLSYADDISLAEELKILYLQHQIDKDMVEMLERVGYLSREFGLEDMSYRFDRNAVLDQVIKEEQQEKAAAAKRENEEGNVS